MNMVGSRADSEERGAGGGRTTLPEWHALQKRRELDRQQDAYRRSRPNDPRGPMKRPG